MEFFTEANELINKIEFLTSEEKRELKTMVEMHNPPFSTWQQCKNFIYVKAQILCEGKLSEDMDGNVPG